jgi:rhodanese-related sulfurtransferase
MDPIDRMLADARQHLRRVTAEGLVRELDAGALLIDVRPVELQDLCGTLPGAHWIGLNVLEWRLAPSSPYRLLPLEPDTRVILVADEGFSSSLAAARLQALGLAGATDLVGGFQALLETGLIDVLARRVE